MSAPPIIDLAEFDESSNIQIYGDSGAGKTVFGGTAPKALILATEKGAISAARQGSKAKLWQIADWAEFEKAYDWLYDNDGEHGFEWIVIDSGPTAQDMALQAILRNQVDKNPERDPDIPAIQDHQKWQNMFKRFIKGFCDLQTNCLFTATAQRHEDEEGEDLILPSYLGKGYGISQWVCAQMSAVGYLEAVKVKQADKSTKVVRRIHWQKNEAYFAKDRYDVLGQYTDDWNMAHVAKRIAQPK